MRKTITLLLLLLFIAGLSFALGAVAHREKYIARARQFLSGQPASQTEAALDPIAEPTAEPTLLQRENVYPSLNELPLPPEDTGEPLSFLVAGHIYGSHDEEMVHPAVTLLTNVQLINQMGLDMFLSLGDIVPEASAEEFERFEHNFLDYMQIPVFNAVGNHDVAERERYERRYGETMQAFVHKAHLFLVLDTVIEDCSLTAAQLDFISAQIESARADQDLKGVHLLMHNVLFLDAETLSSETIALPNVTCPPDEAFAAVVQETLAPLSAAVPVYLYAGDVGAWDHNLSPYYEILPGTGITLIATGLASGAGDSVILAREIDGELGFEVLSLTGQNTLPIEAYDYQYWVERGQ